jgi:hypothetical protein
LHSTYALLERVRDLNVCRIDWITECIARVCQRFVAVAKHTQGQNEECSFCTNSPMFDHYVGLQHTQTRLLLVSTRESKSAHASERICLAHFTECQSTKGCATRDRVRRRRAQHGWWRRCRPIHAATTGLQRISAVVDEALLARARKTIVRILTDGVRITVV